MPKKKQRSQAMSFLNKDSGDSSSPRPPCPAPALNREPVLSPVNSKVSVGSSAVTSTSAEPRSPSASSDLRRPSAARLSALAQERSNSSSPGTPPLSSTVAGNAAPPDLLEIINLRGASLQQAALDLIDAYQQDPAPAIIEVVRLTLAVSGSRYDLKIENLENMEIAEVVVEAADVDLLLEQCPVLGDIRRNFVC